MADKRWDIKDFVSKKVDIRWEIEVHGKSHVKWYQGTLIQLFDEDRAEVCFDNFEVDGSPTVELSVKQVKPPRKTKEPKAKVPAAPAAVGKSYADLLKPPPAPKAEPAVSHAGNQTAQAKPVAGAFDYEKFTAYVKKLHPDFATAIYRPTEEQLERVKNVAFTNHFNERKAERYASTLQELNRSLKTTQDCFMFNETRYMFYLPTTQEIDRQDGWDVKTSNKSNTAEGSYLTFNADFTRIFDVNDRVKGDRKAQNVTAVNIVEKEAALPIEARPHKSLVERARGAIAKWNDNVARSNKNNTGASTKGSELRPVQYTEEAVHLLSQAFERVFPLNTIAMVSTTTTCIFTGDLSATITCIRNEIRYADWVGHANKGGTHYNNNKKGGNNMNINGKRKPTEAVEVAEGGRKPNHHPKKRDGNGNGTNNNHQRKGNKAAARAD